MPLVSTTLLLFLFNYFCISPSGPGHLLLLVEVHWKVLYRSQVVSSLSCQLVQLSRHICQIFSLAEKRPPASYYVSASFEYPPHSLFLWLLHDRSMAFGM